MDHHRTKDSPVVSYALIALLVDLVLDRPHILSANDVVLLIVDDAFLGDIEGKDTLPFQPSSVRPESEESKPVAPGGVGRGAESSEDISDDVETLFRESDREPPAK